MEALMEQALAAKDAEKQEAIAVLTAQKPWGARFWSCFERKPKGAAQTTHHGIV